MKIRNLLLALLLMITASAEAKVGDVITLDSLTVGTDQLTPEYCDNWVVYKWEGIMRFTVTSESPKECVVYGKMVDGSYLPAINDPEGKLVKNSACHLIIPQKVAGYKVVGVDDGAFYKSNFLTSVHLPEGLRWIGKDCFYES